MELYAKISPSSRGVFKYCVTIWKSEDGIESIWLVHRFFRCSSSIRWAQKEIVKYCTRSGSTVLIREKDIMRRKWND